MRDIVPSDGGSWRWTAAEPELRFVLQSNQNRKLLFEFVINERTFQDTGPVTISFFVNKHRFGRETYDSPGDKSFEKPVPSEWIHPKEETRVMARIENPWQSPEGPMGVLLKRVGFVAVKPLSILLSALFTIATAESLGLLLLQRLHPRLTSAGTVSVWIRLRLGGAESACVCDRGRRIWFGRRHSR